MKQKLVENGNEISENARTSLAEACERVMKVLATQQKPYSISGISRESGLHRKTVEKCIQLMVNLESKWLDDYKLAMHTVDNKKIIRLERRTGLLSYPLDVQSLILRARHFPMPSNETYVIMNLFLQDAISRKTAIDLKEDEMTKKLVTQGQIIKSEDGFYLSQEGLTVAEGALKLYPFLKQHKSEK
jgi:hypothetical protein